MKALLPGCCWLTGLIVALLPIASASGQSLLGYTLVGSAGLGSTANCIQLTHSGNGLTGAVWFDKRLRLTNSFELAFTINLGDNPNGADGLVMVFQTQGNTAKGGPSGGLGYNGITPSIGVEFDTNQNFEYGDPAEDHVALVGNGLSDHRLNTGLPAPVPILPTQSNLRDGRDHHVKVRWDAPTKTLRVEVDCIPRLSHSIDLINTIFGGTSEVIWGFTATTGARGNAHTVCLPKTVSAPDTLRACPGEQLALNAPLSGNGQYQWLPTTGLDAPQSRTPRLIADSSRLYAVRYTDQCSQPKFDSVFVKLKSPAVSLGGDKQVCEGDMVMLTPVLTPGNVPVLYQWASGETTPRLTPITSGVYTLTVTGNGCSASASVRVMFNALPKLSLPASLTYDCPGRQSMLLDPQAIGAGLHYAWSPGSSSDPKLQVTGRGQYTVMITTAAGCSAVQQFVILDNCPSELLIVPDAFTPNGDGTNDVLVWQSTLTADPLMRIFNVWGELIFESDTATPYWDGTYKGQSCPVGTYAWIMQYRSQTSLETFTKTGRVLLLK